MSNKPNPPSSATAGRRCRLGIMRACGSFVAHYLSVFVVQVAALRTCLSLAEWLVLAHNQPLRRKRIPGEEHVCLNRSCTLVKDCCCCLLFPARAPTSKRSNNSASKRSSVARAQLMTPQPCVLLLGRSTPKRVSANKHHWRSHASSCFHKRSAIAL